MCRMRRGPSRRRPASSRNAFNAAPSIQRLGGEEEAARETCSEQRVVVRTEEEERAAGGQGLEERRCVSNSRAVLDLPEDVQLHIFSQLDLADVRSCIFTCRSFRSVLLERDAAKMAVWWSLMTRAWPWLSAADSTRLSPTDRKHSFLLLHSAAHHPTHIDVAFTAPPNPEWPQWRWPDFRSFQMSTSAHTDLHVIQFVRPVGQGDRSVRSNAPFPCPLANRSSMSQTTRHKLRISALHAHADSGHSIRTIHTNEPTDTCHQQQQDHPLQAGHTLTPRSCNQTTGNTTNTLAALSSSPTTAAFMGMLRRGNLNVRCGNYNTSRPIICDTRLAPVPFVSPFATVSPLSGQLEWNCTPRMAAYYEVSLLPRDLKQEPVQPNSISNVTTHYRTNAANGRTRVNNNESRSLTEALAALSQIQQDFLNELLNVDGSLLPATELDCVAIGLSTTNFPIRDKMPGWDYYSYGYHGDDGGIFHGRGDMVRAYGPTFHAGDTVGCGIAYQNGGIFFTLNGKFLDYAWTEVDAVLDSGRTRLYPTIGVDIHCPLACNFGTRPFVFDFAKFVSNPLSPPSHHTKEEPAV